MRIIEPLVKGQLERECLLRAVHLDWLRALIVFLLIPYHTAWIFSGQSWIISSPISNPVALAFTQVFDQFQMP